MLKLRLGILLLICLVGLPPRVAQADADETGQAAAVASRFVALLDAGTAGAAWTELTPFAQIIKSEAQWPRLQQALRVAYGPLEKRRLRSVTMQERYAMLPDGRFAIVQFDTTFGSKHGAVETVVLARAADGRWRVHEYVIN